jgi:hypothetical protein
MSSQDITIAGIFDTLLSIGKFKSFSSSLDRLAPPQVLLLVQQKICPLREICRLAQAQLNTVKVGLHRCTNLHIAVGGRISLCRQQIQQAGAKDEGRSQFIKRERDRDRDRDRGESRRFW